jgi:hypothetical protein
VPEMLWKLTRRRGKVPIPRIITLSKSETVSHRSTACQEKGSFSRKMASESLEHAAD